MNVQTSFANLIKENEALGKEVSLKASVVINLKRFEGSFKVYMTDFF